MNVGWKDKLTNVSNFGEKRKHIFFSVSLKEREKGKERGGGEGGGGHRFILLSEFPSF